MRGAFGAVTPIRGLRDESVWKRVVGERWSRDRPCRSALGLNVLCGREPTPPTRGIAVGQLAILDQFAQYLAPRPSCDRFGQCVAVGQLRHGLIQSVQVMRADARHTGDDCDKHLTVNLRPGAVVARDRVQSGHGVSDYPLRPPPAVSRVRRRIKDEMTQDIAILEEHHPDLFDELREVVCED